MKLTLRSQPPETVIWMIAPSPVGKLVIGQNEQSAICRIAFLNGSSADILAEWQAQWPKTKFAKSSLAKNILRQPVLLVGTAFQQAVWKQIARIPHGKVMTYADIAERIGKPRAARAVGGACGANPVPYLVPCHRVIASNGGWGGFSGGLAIKKKLLRAEHPDSRSKNFS